MWSRAFSARVRDICAWAGSLALAATSAPSMLGSMGAEGPLQAAFIPDIAKSFH